MTDQSTICALATPAGTGALAIIRLSGEKAWVITEKIFKPQGRPFAPAPNSISYGTIYDEDLIIDEVLASFFKAPYSYSGEDIVEFSCHGSPYIQQQILQLLIKNDARLAQPGEFTLRAFLNNKMDLSQAEAVADLIASNSKVSHEIAINQIRGGYSKKMEQLRSELLKFTSLIELELDFSEENVEFAKRTELLDLLNALDREISILTDSFSVGNALKNGIPVAIIGKPNVGKSTLLNILLNEDKAIVSEIPGTTRDAIEDTINIKGISFRFIDTAGLRESTEKIEAIGIQRTYEKIKQAKIILYLFDISNTSLDEISNTIHDFQEHIEGTDKKLIIIANMIDKLIEMPKSFKELLKYETIYISAKRRENIQMIINSLLKNVEHENATEGTIVTNARHFEALNNARAALIRVKNGISEKIPADLCAQDLREALYHIGSITGTVTNNEILESIFKNFCIGK